MKPPPARYRISDLAEHCGLARQTIHLYAQMGMLKTANRAKGGMRIFNVDAFERIGLIKRLHRHRVLKEVQAVLAVLDKTGKFGKNIRAGHYNSAG